MDDEDDDIMQMDVDDDPVTSLRNRLRHSHFPARSRARPVSFPPAFVSPSSIPTAFRKQKLLDRTPQAIRTSREAECTSVAQRSRKVKFADEEGKDLASYFEIPENKALSDLGSLLDNAIGEIEAEYEEKFGSRIPDVVPHIETIVPRKTIFDYLRGKEETVLRHSRRRAHSCSPDRSSNKQFEPRPTRPFSPLLPATNKNRVYSVGKENIPERPSRGILKRTKPQKPKQTVETGDILSLSHSNRRCALPSRPSLHKYRFEECVETAVNKQQTYGDSFVNKAINNQQNYDENFPTSADHFSAHLPAVGLPGCFGNKSSVQPEHSSYPLPMHCADRSIDNTEVICPVSTSSFGIRTAGSTDSNQTCQHPGGEKYPRMDESLVFTYTPLTSTHATPASTIPDKRIAVSSHISHVKDPNFQTDNKNEFLNNSAHRALFKQSESIPWTCDIKDSNTSETRGPSPSSTTPHYLTDLNSNTARDNPSHDFDLKSSPVHKSEGRLYEPLPKMSKNMPKPYLPGDSLFSETGLFKTERLLQRRPLLNRPVCNKIRKMSDVDSSAQKPHRQDSIEEELEHSNQPFSGFKTISQSLKTRYDAGINVSPSKQRSKLFRSPSPKTELRQVRIIEKTVTIEETTYSPSISPTFTKPFKYSSKILPKGDLQCKSDKLLADSCYSQDDAFKGDINTKLSDILGGTENDHYEDVFTPNLENVWNDDFRIETHSVENSTLRDSKDILSRGDTMRSAESKSRQMTSEHSDQDIQTLKGSYDHGEQNANLSFEMSLNVFQNTYENMLSSNSDLEKLPSAAEEPSRDRDGTKNTALDKIQANVTQATALAHYADHKPSQASNQLVSSSNGGEAEQCSDDSQPNSCSKDNKCNVLTTNNDSSTIYEQPFTLISKDTSMPAAGQIEKQKNMGGFPQEQETSNTAREQTKPSITPINASANTLSNTLTLVSDPALHSNNNAIINNLAADQNSDVELETTNTSIDKKNISEESYSDNGNDGPNSCGFNEDSTKPNLHVSVTGNTNTNVSSASVCHEKPNLTSAGASDKTKCYETNCMSKSQVSENGTSANKSLSQNAALCSMDSNTESDDNDKASETVSFENEIPPETSLSFEYHFCLDKSTLSNSTIFDTSMDTSRDFSTPEQTFELSPPDDYVQSPTVMSDSITSDDCSELTYVLPDQGHDKCETQMSVEQLCTILLSGHDSNGLSSSSHASDNSQDSLSQQQSCEKNKDTSSSESVLRNMDINAPEVVETVNTGYSDADGNGTYFLSSKSDARSHRVNASYSNGSDIIRNDNNRSHNNKSGTESGGDNRNYTSGCDAGSDTENRNHGGSKTENEDCAKNRTNESDAQNRNYGNEGDTTSDRASRNSICVHDSESDGENRSLGNGGDTEGDGDNISITEYARGFVAECSHTGAGHDRDQTCDHTCVSETYAHAQMPENQDQFVTIGQVSYDDLNQDGDWPVQNDDTSCDSSDSCHGSDTDEDEILSISIESGSEHVLSDSDNECVTDDTQTERPAIYKTMSRHRRSLSSDDISKFRSYSNTSTSLTSVTKLSDKPSSLDIYSLEVVTAPKEQPLLSRSVVEDLGVVCDKIGRSEECIVTDEVHVDYEPVRRTRMYSSGTNSDSETETKTCCSWIGPTAKGLTSAQMSHSRAQPRSRTMEQSVDSPSPSPVVTEIRPALCKHSPCCSASRHAHDNPATDVLSLDNTCDTTTCIATTQRGAQTDQSKSICEEKQTSVRSVDV